VRKSMNFPCNDVINAHPLRNLSTISPRYVLTPVIEGRWDRGEGQ
jgi:hypothetical protein